MKQVIQLDASGYFVGTTSADESPLEEGVFLLPAGAVDAPLPEIPSGKRAKWDGAWFFEDIPEPEPDPKEEPIDPVVACKAIAKYRLEETDWSQVADVTAALLNKSAFDAYRAAVRALYFRPVAEPVWPERPEAQWPVA